MYPGGVWSWWGTDPRITTPEIATLVGRERTAIWARFGHWKRIGFWDGSEIRTNPRVFGVDQVQLEIPVIGPAQGAEVLDQLADVDGVLGAWVLFGMSLHGREGETVRVSLAAENAKRVNRRIRILRGLSSTGDLEGPFRDSPPPCLRPLTPLDWRVLAAVIANPNSSPGRLARLVGITPKTFSYHRDLLIEHHAIFYHPKLNWSKLECAFLLLCCRESEDVGAVRAELQARYPASIPMDLKGGEGISPEWDDSTCFAAIVPAHSPNAVHELIRDVSGIPGARLVRADTAGPERLYFDWVNCQVAERIAATAGGVPGRAPRLGSRKRIALVAARSTESRELTAH